MQSLAAFLSRNKTLILAFIFFFLFSVFIKVFAADWPYNPGATLNPGCPPSEGTCIVTAGTIAGGDDTQVQYNDGGVLAGDENFTWDKINKIFTVGDSTGSGNFTTLTVDDSTQDITGNVVINSGTGEMTGLDVSLGGAQVVYRNGIGGAWGFEGASVGGGQTLIHANTTDWIWPNSDSTGTQALVSDGSGNLDWADLGSIETGFTEGSVAFQGALGALTEDNSNFFWKDSTDQLAIGVAGIYVTNPVRPTSIPLQISSIDDASIMSKSTTDNTNSYTGMNMQDYTGTLAASFQYGNPGATTFPNQFVIASRQADIPINIYQGGSSSTNKRIVVGDDATIQLLNADVGIGTTTPAYLLDLVGSNAVGGITESIQNTNAAGRTNFQLANDADVAGLFLSTFGTSYYGAGGYNLNGLVAAENNLILGSDGGVSTGGTSSMSFLTGGFNMTTQTRMFIDSAGKVGIGTTTPATIFNVVQPDSDQAIQISRTGFLDAGFTVSENISEYTLLGVGGIANKFQTVFDITNGFVGINNTSPSVALDIDGDIEYTGTITDVSDERLKENITEYTGGLDLVKQVGVKNYNMISSPEKYETGFIAQNINEIFPQAVSIVDPANGYMGVSYVSFIPVLTQAIQELDLKVEAMRDFEDETFVEKLTNYFTDAANRIEDLFVNRVHTRTLCVGEEGDETCITKSELDALLEGQNLSVEGNNDSEENITEENTEEEVIEETVEEEVLEDLIEEEVVVEDVDVLE